LRVSRLNLNTFQVSGESIKVSRTKVARRSKRQAGFTLIEALVVMMVGVVVLASAAAGIGKLFRSSEISAEASNITQMAAAIRSIKNGAAGYEGLNNMLAIQFGAVPANMTQSITGTTGTITNGWNGAVTIAPVAGNQSFSIAYANVPTQACQQLALKLRAAGWASLTVAAAAGAGAGGGGGGAGGGGAGAAGTTINATTTLAQIQGACNGGDNNVLTFVSAN
jgi:prepilin-type N-terminal cleavage/methylation domain-containing protein